MVPLGLRDAEIRDLDQQALAWVSELLMEVRPLSAVPTRPLALPSCWLTAERGVDVGPDTLGDGVGAAVVHRVGHAVSGADALFASPAARYSCG